MPRSRGASSIAQNKKARHDYHIEDTYEAGLVLVGTEVKSLRMGRASLVDGFVDIDGHEAWLHGVHIPEYTQGTWTNHSARRKRKLLLNRAEIDKIERQVNEKGLTIVPLALYFIDGRAKVEIALAKGKKSWDKRHALAERQANREKEQAVGRRLKGMDVTDGSATGPSRRRRRTRAFWQDLGLPGLFDVHVHFLPAEHPARGSTSSSTRPGPKIGREWPIRYRGSRRGARRAAARRSAYAASRRCPTRTGPASRRTSTTGRAASPPTCPSRCGRRRSTPSPRRRRTSPSWSPPASRCSRCTCRWGSSTSTTRCSTTVWGLLEDAGTPIVVHAGSGPVGNDVHRARPAAPGAGPLPAAGGGRRAHGRAGVRRVPGAGRALRAGPPRHHDGVHGLLRRRGAVPARRCCRGWSTCSRRCCSAATSRPSPTPTPHQLEALAPARPRGRLAARRVLAQRRPAVRGIRPVRRWAASWPSRRLAVDNSRGADRFRLGTLVPGEAGRGASVIS